MPCLQVPSQVAKGFVCISCVAVYMGPPGKVTGNVHAAQFCARYYLMSLTMHGIFCWDRGS